VSAPRAVPTWGLTHIALAVEDVDRAFRFYRDVFGAREVYRGEGFLQAQTPGSRDVLVFQEDAARRPGPAGEPARRATGGGIAHFGFRLRNPDDIGDAVAAVERAGGTVIDRGEFCPGEPYVFFTDPDGYLVEIWHEIPTPFDPPEGPGA
jgi:catechol 2,3-dioxygenase-like lactoylglutathione lyase family enzyme